MGLKLHIHLANGRRFRSLNIVDDYTRQCQKNNWLDRCLADEGGGSVVSRGSKMHSLWCPYRPKKDQQGSDGVKPWRDLKGIACASYGELLDGREAGVA